MCVCVFKQLALLSRLGWWRCLGRVWDFAQTSYTKDTLGARHSDIMNTLREQAEDEIKKAAESGGIARTQNGRRKVVKPGDEDWNAAADTIIAGAQEIIRMISVGQVTLGDLLLLFIYLEVIAMVAVYLESGKLPIRMPIYIAIVALARYLALDSKEMDTWQFLAVSGAIVILAFAVLVIRYGHAKFPYSRMNYLKEKPDE